MIRRQRDNAKKRQRNLLSRVIFYRESCWRVPSSEFINSFFKHSNICNSFFTLGKVHKLTRVLNLNVHYLMRCKQRESWTHIISAGVDMIRNEYVRRPPTAGILRHFFWFLRFLTGVWCWSFGPKKKGLKREMGAGIPTYKSDPDEDSKSRPCRSIL